jgi:HD-like signal output (HDOD) protein
VRRWAAKQRSPAITMDTSSTSLIAEFSAQSAAFRFVALLAGEVSKGQIDLPAFPEAVARVKQALSDEHVSPAMIARVVMSEAGLAARLMTLANSTIMNPSGTPTNELKSAVARIGYNNVRASAVAYAIAKLRQADNLQAIRGELELLWKEATGTAALAHAIARHAPGINADEALLTGLVHNIGKVYILSRSQQVQNPEFSLSDTAVLVRDWHANVGKAIVESWKFAPQIAAAIGNFEDPDRNHRQADLGDVLSLASQLYRYVDQAPTDIVLPETLLCDRASLQLSMDALTLQQIVRAGSKALQELRAALGA